MKRKTVRPIVKAYRKAVSAFFRKVSAFFRKGRSMARRGYVIDAVLPKEPKKITEASVRRIKKISSNLYKKSYYVTEEGEVISGEEGRKYERSMAAKKAAETRKRNKRIGEIPIRYDWEIAFDWLEGIIKQVEERGMERVANAIRDIVDAAVIRSSEREVGMIIVSQQAEVLQSIQEIAEAFYSAQSGKYSYAVSKLSQLLGGGAITAAQFSEYESADEDGEYEYR